MHFVMHKGSCIKNWIKVLVAEILSKQKPFASMYSSIQKYHALLTSYAKKLCNSKCFRMSLSCNNMFAILTCAQSRLHVGILQ